MNQWQWNFGDPASGASNTSSLQNPSHTFSSSGTYTVTLIATDAFGAKDTLQQVVSVTALPISINQDSMLCKGKSVTLTASGASSYTWSPSTHLDNNSGSTVVSSTPITTTYTVNYIDANNCTGVDTHTVYVLDYPKLTVTKSNDLECSKTSSQLQATGASSYIWTPSLGLSDVNISNPVAVVDKTTTFYVTRSDYNCSTTDSITVNVYDDVLKYLYLPNSFTPNGDGINDCFRIRFNALPVFNYKFRIYNRWGQAVFETDNPSDCWNGNDKNHTAFKLSQDTY